MTENTAPETEPKSPAEAFENLRREVAFMRRAIERMADDHRAAPDYSETLGRMASGLKEASKSLDWLTQRPIVKTTVDDMAQEISDAGNRARAADKRTIADTAGALRDVTRDLSGWLASARQADDQERQLLRFSSGAAATGAVVAIILTIGCFRLFPEHGAAWLLEKSRCEAGQQFMASPLILRDGQLCSKPAILPGTIIKPLPFARRTLNAIDQDQHCHVIVKGVFKPEK
jgi:hypothetical protein